jgi:hypothetical protein
MSPARDLPDETYFGKNTLPDVEAAITAQRTGA